MNKTTKIVLIFLAMVLLFVGIIYLIEKKGDDSSVESNNKVPVEENEEVETNQEINKDDMSEFIACLKNAGIIIYGSETCPACAELAESLGGYDLIEPIYVECSINQERCNNEMKTNYVPEIQINGELYEGPRTPEGFSQKTGCKL